MELKLKGKYCVVLLVKQTPWQKYDWISNKFLNTSPLLYISHWISKMSFNALLLLEVYKIIKFSVQWRKYVAQTGQVIIPILFQPIWAETLPLFHSMMLKQPCWSHLVHYMTCRSCNHLIMIIINYDQNRTYIIYIHCSHLPYLSYWSTLCIDGIYVWFK